MATLPYDGDGLRGELPADMSVDIANSIAAAIADEPAIVAPKRRLRDLPVGSNPTSYNQASFW